MYFVFVINSKTFIFQRPHKYHDVFETGMESEIARCRHNLGLKQHKLMLSSGFYTMTYRYQQ